ncbi:MAG: zeta toxin family protein [bacterium]|nr:zeta toxin family protein [bacterium]
MKSDKEIEEEAISFAKSHKEEIARELTSLEKFPKDSSPVSVFMAGSPGAGKTESSHRLIERFSGGGHAVLRIDPDDLRVRFQDYNGKNSPLFQGATTIIAERMQDMAIEHNQNYIFDGTLTNLKKAQENISRGLKHDRVVQILYIYQDPLQAWKFVQDREKKDGRVIPKDVFVQQYFQARANVNQLKKEFGSRLRVDIIVKNIDGSDFQYKENIGVIDSYISESYTQDTLSASLNTL